MLIILKKVTISALGLAALLPLAGAEWRVESPLPGILELANAVSYTHLTLPTNSRV